MKGRGPRPAESSPEQTPSAATESPEREKADGALAEFQPQGRHSVSISPCHWSYGAISHSSVGHNDCMHWTSLEPHSSSVTDTALLTVAVAATAAEWQGQRAWGQLIRPTACPGSQEPTDEAGTVLGTGLSGGGTDTNRTLALSTNRTEREHRGGVESMDFRITEAQVLLLISTGP